jgi:hypothetical protein
MMDVTGDEDIRTKRGDGVALDNRLETSGKRVSLNRRVRDDDCPIGCTIDERREVRGSEGITAIDTDRRP